ncbi:MAG: electron transport complex subunit RsxE, partial [Oscillospiraceae bacterium]|nr:electron transport complex subunit RsxE [Oscillospiraceae bacterium]
IPKQIRIACYVVAVAGLVSVLEMFLKAYVPGIYKSLGLFIPLIVVNCVILARAESFASKNDPVKSAFDGLFMGIGFAFGMFLLATVREIIGAGTFLGITVFPEEFSIKAIVSPPGAFISLGILIAVFKTVTAIIDKKTKKEEEK